MEGGLGRRETFKKADAEAGGRLSRAAGEVPSGLCPVPLALQLAGLFSCVLVLSVLLWLGPLFYYLPKVSSRAGEGRLGGAAASPHVGVLSLPPLPQGCLGLHQHLQHAPDVLPDARTPSAVAHQPRGLCEKRQRGSQMPPPTFLASPASALDQSSLSQS